MPESSALKFKRKLRSIDNAYLNATAYLLEQYYCLLRADPVLAGGVEMMLRQTDEIRAHLHDLYIAAWESDHACFDSVGQVSALIAEAREDVLGRKASCQEYCNVLDLSAKASSKVLEKRAAAFSKPSA